MRKIFLTGWATPPSLFTPLLSEDWEIVDSTMLITQNPNDWHNGAWAHKFATELSLQPGDTLMGYSMGAIIALGISSVVAVHLTLFSPCTSFIWRPHHPSGIPLAELKTLQQAIASSPQRALAQFFRRAHITAPLDAYHTNSLLSGLEFLAEVDLPTSRKPLSCTIYHSEEDLIIPLLSGEEVAQRYDSRLITIPGGHGAIFPFLMLPFSLS